MSRGCVFAIMFVLGTIPSAQAQKPALEGVVNINTASPEELRLLPGVGPSRIRNILAYRQKHPFRTVEELARIKGIGRKTVRALRQHLAVSGPSTAQKVIRPVAPVAPPPRQTPPPQGRLTQRSIPGQRLPPGKGEPAHDAVASLRGSAGLPPP